MVKPDAGLTIQVSLIVSLKEPSTVSLPEESVEIILVVRDAQSTMH